jgi:Fe(3+) dicitrate transport protein
MRKFERVAGMVVLALVLLFLLAADGWSQDHGGLLAGRTIDEAGRVVSGVTINIVRLPEKSGIAVTTVTDENGRFSFANLLVGRYEIQGRGEGFNRIEQKVEVREGEESWVEMRLSVGRIAEEVLILSTTITGQTEGLPRIPGSVETIDRRTLEQSRVFTVNEALRKVSGVNTRDEEGLGLRPNIGMRGVNPTRSTKVLLLEDGIPLAYAPYGDNASYYHPPVERFESIEVLKGSGQIVYGPSTIGGVINYLTPNPPSKSSGSVTLIGGNRRFFNGGVGFGGSWRETGLILNYVRKQSDGSRENIHADLNDLSLKVQQTLTDRQSLTVKASYYGERSNLTYSGLTEDEFRANPRGNPFRNDFFIGDRAGASISHAYVVNANVALTTNLYGMRFNRDWWRQSSNSNQRPNDGGDPNCGGMVNLMTTCGNEGRLRRYENWGLEPRLRANFGLFGMRHELDLGGRYHYENQERRQENGDSPVARSGKLVEDNRRRNQALSSYIQNRFGLGRLSITPGLRVERISFLRTNRLADGGRGVTGEVRRTQLIPGVGFSYSAGVNTIIFSGIHRGFAPPRTEDIISNTTGGSIDLDPELSWNYEAGVRHQIGSHLRAEATVFRLNYANQIIPASLAGGVGAALTNGGKTLQQGVEISSRIDTGLLPKGLGNGARLFSTIAWTWLPVAEFHGDRYSNVQGFSTVRITGNRVPYTPEQLLNVNLGYSQPAGLTALIEGVHTGAQSGDDLNTIAPTANGQRGRIPGNTIWNTTINYEVEAIRSTFFVTVKNLFDRTVIVDRSRGILPGLPRLLQVGVRFEFRN